ncbi:hypothetical protein LPJ57_004623, partial [Coemansia sp. RSA 486]
IVGSVSVITEQVSNKLEEHISDVASGCEFNSLVMDRTQEGSSKPFKNEHSMYGPLTKLIAYIADQVDEAAKMNGAVNVRRLIKIYEKTDHKPVGSDDNKRPDIALTFVEQQNSANNNANTDTAYKNKDYIHPEYSDMLCFIEAKTEKTKQNDAYAQAYMYTRNIYACQHNRQFVWALTICDSVLRICLFTNDKMFVSDELDISSKSGRRGFVEFVARVSFCDIYYLGYDPTIRYNPKIGKWQIDVFSNDKTEPKTLILESVLHNATRTTGRHTRCFVGLDEESKEQLLVKDAWAEQTRRPEFIEANSDYSAVEVPMAFERDEIKLLEKVDEKLGKDNTFERRYPVIKYGGVVRQNLANNLRGAMETTYTALLNIGPVVQSNVVPYRIHKRMAVTPIAESLRNLCSIDEYIVVMAEAMLTLCYIEKECGILHRDISSNNIMFTRDEDGTVRGFLNDFDCAIEVTAERKPRTNMTGTLPFMSICNLESKNVDQTILDDLESCIYHMCWFGVEGVCSLHEDYPTDNDMAHLSRWRIGTVEHIAEAKRNNMHTDDNFKFGVTNRFIGAKQCKNHGDEHGNCLYKNLGYDRLASLVCQLRKALFENDKLSRKCWGAMDPNSLSAQPSTRVAPMHVDDEFGDIFDESSDVSSSSKPTDTPNVESGAAADKGYEDPSCGPDRFANRALGKCKKIIVKDIVRIIRNERNIALENIKKQTQHKK